MKPVYLLLGPEQGEKANFMKNILKQIKEKTGEKPEITRYYPFEKEMVEIISYLQNGSLFASHKVVLINEVDTITKKNGLDLLIAYCEQPAPQTTLFLLSEKIQAVDKKLEGTVSKDCKVIFWELFENKKIDWIRSYFRQHRIQIEQEAIDFLLEMIENNTKDLKDECQRLALFFGEGTRLSLKEIEQYVYHSKEENVFTLFEKLAVRDLAGSEEIITKMFLAKEADSVAIMAGLLWQIRQLHTFLCLLADNYSAEDAFGKLKIRHKKSQKIFLEASKKYSLAEAEALIQLVYEFNVRFRSVKADLHMLLLQLFVYYAIARGGKIPAPEFTLSLF